MRIQSSPPCPVYLRDYGVCATPCAPSVGAGRVFWRAALPRDVRAFTAVREPERFWVNYAFGGASYAHSPAMTADKRALYRIRQVANNRNEAGCWRKAIMSACLQLEIPDQVRPGTSLLWAAGLGQAGLYEDRRAGSAYAESNSRSAEYCDTGRDPYAVGKSV